MPRRVRLYLDGMPYEDFVLSEASDAFGGISISTLEFTDNMGILRIIPIRAIRMVCLIPDDETYEKVNKSLPF